MRISKQISQFQFELSCTRALRLSSVFERPIVQYFLAKQKINGQIVDS